MEQTNHVLLVGEGADLFAREQGFPFVATEELISPHAREVLEEFRSYHNAVQSQFTSSANPELDERNVRSHPLRDTHDTVGCVALCKGNLLAAGTSTGGIAAKRVGRVGDSPLIGSGYICNRYFLPRFV